MTMYEKPVLTLVGTMASVVLGACENGNTDLFPEANWRKCEDIPEGLDD
jgi:hypothetical protein